MKTLIALALIVGGGLVIYVVFFGADILPSWLKTALAGPGSEPGSNKPGDTGSTGNTGNKPPTQSGPTTTAPGTGIR